LQQVFDRMGVSDRSGGVAGVAGRMSSDDISKIQDPALKAAFERYAKTEDKEAAAKALTADLVKVGGKEAVSLEGAKTGGIQGRIAEMEEMKKQLSRRGGTRADSDMMFATSVQLFAEATRGLVKASNDDKAKGSTLDAIGNWFKSAPGK